MNREILFKAKRIDNGEWVEGDLEHTKYDDVIWIVDVRGEKCYRCDSGTLCQYTGLTDEDGWKIWENDIVEIASEDGYFLCEWDDDAARYVLNGDGLTVDFDNYYGYECEVVGNVFDDGELLEEE